ncbi:MAG: hypothetical protein PUK21_07715 [Peptostreptococcaceae bacterium]|nr:hypothetical protein [Peptostreptococcaceae bacterium]SFE35273.1 hypothetical protein SAMN02910327_00981 [Peptostreptococcaceae bacterium pGA-8]
MAREWQQTKMTDFLLPDEVYYQCLWAVRDLRRMERAAMEMKKREGYSPLQIMNMEARVRAIRGALCQVPEAYREYIMRSIIAHDTGRNFPTDMWKPWKQKFLYNVAVNLSIV